MSIHSTNSLLDLCRNGIRLKNVSADTAAQELASYVVFASLMEEQTEVPPELEDRVVLLTSASVNPELFPEDMVEEVEEDAPAPDDGPLVA